jgi:hypothetical protein
MACGNNMVSRSGLQSEPAATSMPSGPGPASRNAVTEAQAEAAQRQIRDSMDEAERRAAAATTPSAAIEAVKDAQRAVDRARRMAGPARERDALVRDLESRLGKCKSAAEKTIGALRHELDAGGARLNRDQLGVRDRQAIRNYTRADNVGLDSHQAFNSAMSGKGPGAQQVTVDKLADSAQAINDLSAALAKLSAQPGTVYRGAASPLSTQEIDRYEPGETVVEPRFLSATVDPEREFSKYGGNAIWVIESKTGRSVADYADAAVAYEKEVLFDKFARFEVFAKLYNDELQAWVIYMEEV